MFGKVQLTGRLHIFYLEILPQSRFWWSTCCLSVTQTHAIVLIVAIVLTSLQQNVKDAVVWLPKPVTGSLTALIVSVLTGLISGE